MSETNLDAVEQLVEQRRANRERAAVLVFDVRDELRAITRTATIVGSRTLCDVVLRLSDALVLLEAGGVPTPRLPTEQELER